MPQLLLVAIGGALGSMARYAIGVWVADEDARAFPTATLVVNLIGCLLIGVAWSVIEHHQLGTRERAFLVIGVLGGFTTFSSFGWETIRLIEAQRHFPALCYVSASLIGGIFLAWCGWVVMQRLMG